ncbi:hypothetical protein ABT061_25485 [Streptosporangium sp. NPDC002544]|uniref:hypothetical protein n=1 Tax=Streptosporangium sp. NPDC002544 TaxID=3154538 RepID=UPI003325E42F
MLGRTRRAARNLANLVLDDDGSAHAAWLAANAERNAVNAPRRAALVDQARRRARELRSRGHHDAAPAFLGSSVSGERKAGRPVRGRTVVGQAPRPHCSPRTPATAMDCGSR